MGGAAAGRTGCGFAAGGRMAGGFAAGGEFEGLGAGAAGGLGTLTGDIGMPRSEKN